eukprot:TRINITY_DN6724_c1_g1_i1.p1 TRINITY_DN6724_c1_g1~~TRINITY_DN6724_c1_g1_i1.p1  ORF type:complete len:682 (+),score=108.26 TRINITY_DN6724_c1_g1_i1:35-2080(+)
MASRRQFCSELLRADVQKVASWHSTRPQHEQRRFVQTIASLHSSSFEKQETKRRAVSQSQEPSPLEVVGVAPEQKTATKQKTSLGESLRAAAQTREPSAAALKLRKPGLSLRNPNSFLDWLDGQSAKSSSTGSTCSRRTGGFSQAAETDSDASSICSFPGTAQQTHFRHHLRGAAANKGVAQAIDQHAEGELTEGISKDGIYPLDKYIMTSYQGSYGTPQEAVPTTEQKAVSAAKCAGVFKEGAQSLVAEYLEEAPLAQRNALAEVVRSLDVLRTEHARERVSLSHHQYDLQENARLWMPQQQGPTFDKGDLNRSQVPLGAAPRNIAPSAKTIIDNPPCQPTAPPSPDVSALGSLPRTPVHMQQAGSDYNSAISVKSRPSSSARLSSRPASAQSRPVHVPGMQVLRPKSAVSRCPTPAVTQAAAAAVRSQPINLKPPFAKDPNLLRPYSRPSSAPAVGRLQTTSAKELCAAEPRLEGPTAEQPSHASLQATAASEAIHEGRTAPDERRDVQTALELANMQSHESTVASEVIHPCFASSGGRLQSAQTPGDSMPRKPCSRPAFALPSRFSVACSQASKPPSSRPASATGSVPSVLRPASVRGSAKQDVQLHADASRSGQNAKPGPDEPRCQVSCDLHRNGSTMSEASTAAPPSLDDCCDITSTENKTAKSRIRRVGQLAWIV